MDKVYQTIKSLNLSVFDSSGNLSKPGARSEFSDLDMIALSLDTEFMSCEIKLAERFLSFEDHYIIDSMALEVCKLAREKRSKVCAEEFETSPEKGYCAAQKMYFYGYKLQAVCLVTGIFHSIELTKANIHDVNFLSEMNTKLTDFVLIGDKGYLSASIQPDLFHTANIKLETPMRTNQKGFVKQKWIFRKARKRLETLFSQLCDQFMIRRNYTLKHSKDSKLEFLPK